MVAIKHHTLWDGVVDGDGKAVNPLPGTTYNEGHDLGNIADVLTDHNQTTHDWESNGTFTILAGSTSKIVSHGLSGIPKITCSVDAFVIWRITNKTATQFTFEMEAPLDVADLHVDWRAVL